MSKIVMVSDEKFWGAVISRLADHNQLEFEMCDDDVADQEAIQQIVLAAADEVVARIAEKLADGEEEVEFNLDERITFIGSSRENTDGVMNRSLSCIPGSEAKKRIKDDAGLTD